MECMVSYKKPGRGSSHDFWLIFDTNKIKIHWLHWNAWSPSWKQKAGTRRLPWLLIDAQLADRHYSMLPHRQSHLNHRGEKSRKNSLGGAEDHSGASAICFFFSLRAALFHLSFPPYGWSCHWTKSLGAFINVESSVGIFLKLYWRFFPFLWTFFLAPFGVFLVSLASGVQGKDTLQYSTVNLSPFANQNF